MTNQNMKLGFVGLGQMGEPICRNLLQAGHSVNIFDINQAALKRLESDGATITTSLAKLAGTVDLIFTALPSPQISKQVVCGDDGLLSGAHEGLIIAELSTVSPEIVRTIAKTCEPEGVIFVDCGMSGGPAGAAKGELTFMVGGPDNVIQKIRPFLEIMGSNIYHCGDTGAGMAAKLVNNAIAHVNALTLCEGFALGVKNGLDPKVLYDVIETSSGMSWVLPARFRQYIKEGEFNPGMSLDLLHKDSNLAMEMAHETQTPLFLLRLANSLFTWYQLQGMGPENWAKMMQIWEQQLDVRIGAEQPTSES